MQVLFHCQRSFLEVRIHGLYAKLEDGVDSYRASAPNSQSTIMMGASTSMSVVALDCLLADPLSVAVGIARSPPMVPGILGDGESDLVENAMREDDSNEKPAHIVGDSDEDTPKNSPSHQGPSTPLPRSLHER
ncbi:uncharacterized protein DS421_16g534830 [Arachis hypogaea]|nr:uncharacterized protein DS421_16g534830 [Arachis hypogaea]